MNIQSKITHTDALITYQAKRLIMLNKKIAMLGLWGTGKTSLVQQYVHSIYSEKYLSTIGVKIDKKKLTINDTDVNLMLWDIAGAEDNFSVPMHFIKGAAGYLLIIDGTRKFSLEKGMELVEAVKNGVGDIPFTVLVNKCDLEWEITFRDVEQYFQAFDTTVFKTSAKTGENVETAFLNIAEKVI